MVILLQIPLQMQQNGRAEPQGGGVSPPANSLQMQAKLGSGRYRTKVAAGCKSAAKAASGRRKAAGRAAREERQMTLLVTPRSATTPGRGVFGGLGCGADRPR